MPKDKEADKKKPKGKEKPDVVAAPTFASVKAEDKPLFERKVLPPIPEKGESMEDLEKKFFHPSEANPLMEDFDSDNTDSSPLANNRRLDNMINQALSKAQISPNSSSSSGLKKPVINAPLENQSKKPVVSGPRPSEMKKIMKKEIEIPNLPAEEEEVEVEKKELPEDFVTLCDAIGVDTDMSDDEINEKLEELEDKLKSTEASFEEINTSFQNQEISSREFNTSEKVFKKQLHKLQTQIKFLGRLQELKSN
jgi:hypothetical protein